MSARPSSGMVWAFVLSGLAHGAALAGVLALAGGTLPAEAPVILVDLVVEAAPKSAQGASAAPAPEPEPESAPALSPEAARLPAARAAVAEALPSPVPDPPSPTVRSAVAPLPAEPLPPRLAALPPAPEAEPDPKPEPVALRPRPPARPVEDLAPTLAQEAMQEVAAVADAVVEEPAPAVLEEEHRAEPQAEAEAVVPPPLPLARPRSVVAVERTPLPPRRPSIQAAAQDPAPPAPRHPPVAAHEMAAVSAPHRVAPTLADKVASTASLLAEPPQGAEGGPAEPVLVAFGADNRTNDGDGSAGAGADSGPVARAGNPKPRYPLMARKRGHQGRVLLRVSVLADGSAAQVDVRESSGYDSLDEAARAAVRKWRFQPAQQGGHAVAAVIEVPVSFRLTD